jgi:hypothetical protein
MAGDNRCLPYHLARTPPLGGKALRAVPRGAAAVLAMSLSEREGPPRLATVAQVTGLDLGREIFVNMNDILLFVLPPAATGQSQPMSPPDAGLVFTVKDAARSQALWQALLGIPARILEVEPTPVRTEKISGRRVEIYAFPDGLRVHAARLPDRMILATSPAAVAAACSAADGKGSILDDRGFAAAREALGAKTCKVAMVHAGRAFQLAQPFLGRQLGGPEAQWIAPLLAQTTVTVFTEETPSLLHASAVLGLPELGSFVEQALAAGRRRIRLPHSSAAAWHRRDVQRLIPRGSEWKYCDAGEDRGTAWRAAEYDDSSWKSGPAPLGYGEDAVATAISFGDDPASKRATAYFRKSFRVDRPERLRSLEVILRRDDGAAVYLNGDEVLRDNLADGATCGDYSLISVHGDAEGDYLVVPVPPTVLHPGENIIAVEVHQCNGQSSDLVFDLALEGVLRL